MKFSDKLFALLLEIQSSYPTINIRNRAVLLNNLKFVYDMICASEDLCVDAWIQSSDDPLLNTYFFKHNRDEKGHAEWLAADLSTAGVIVNRLQRHTLAIQVAGEQHYRIRYMHPASLLGYIAALEVHPMPIEVIEKLEEIHGKDLIRTLRYHAVHDQDHSAELRDVVDLVDPNFHSLILQTAARTCMILKEAISTFGV